MASTLECLDVWLSPAGPSGGTDGELIIYQNGCNSWVLDGVCPLEGCWDCLSRVSREVTGANVGHLLSNLSVKIRAEKKCML